MRRTLTYDDAAQSLYFQDGDVGCFVSILAAWNRGAREEHLRETFTNPNTPTPIPMIAEQWENLSNRPTKLYPQSR